MNRRPLFFIVPIALVASAFLLFLGDKAGTFELGVLTVSLAITAVVGGAVSSTFRLFTWFTTLVHEMGHAAVGILNGGQISGIVLNADGSGYTVTRHSVNGSRLARNAATLAGYPGPIIFAISLLGLVTLDYSWAAIIIAGVTGALNLIFSRSLLSAGISLAFLGAFGLAAVEHYYTGTSFALLFLGATLFTRGVYDLTTLTRLTMNPGTKADANAVSDAENVARESLILRSVWLWTIMEWLIAFAGGALLVLLVVELSGIPVLAPVMSFIGAPHLLAE